MKKGRAATLELSVGRYLKKNRLVPSVLLKNPFVFQNYLIISDTKTVKSVFFLLFYFQCFLNS